MGNLYITIICLPACILLLCSAIQQPKAKIGKMMTDESFVVMLPSTVAVIGAICALGTLSIMLCFTFFSSACPPLIFYMIYGLLFWLGTYLLIKALTFRVVVKKGIITVFPILSKPYSFTFDEIVSVKRQVKNNRVKSERIIIKTAKNKRLVLEKTEISYNRFIRKVQNEVPKNRIT